MLSFTFKSGSTLQRGDGLAHVAFRDLDEDGDGLGFDEDAL
jgi:hypothetical protein